MKHIVVLTGAGISAESGLSTFRDSGGLWENHDIMEVASIEGWNRNPQLVLDFYNQRRNALNSVVPNIAHFVLSELEKHFKVSIITQNVDDLHERAGSSNIIHLHGELKKMRSTHNTEVLYDCSSDIYWGQCDAKGHQMRPHIVWFGEEVPLLQRAADVCKTASVFIVIGTSLQVYPAASLVHFVPRTAKKYIIDPHLPEFSTMHQFIAISKTAVEGMPELAHQLINE